VPKIGAPKAPLGRKRPAWPAKKPRGPCRAAPPPWGLGPLGLPATARQLPRGAPTLGTRPPWPANRTPKMAKTKPGNRVPGAPTRDSASGLNKNNPARVPGAPTRDSASGLRKTKPGKSARAPNSGLGPQASSKMPMSQLVAVGATHSGRGREKLLPRS